MLSKYAFERTELRTLQNTCNGDNEKFLNMLADIIGELTVERDYNRMRAQIAEGLLSEVKNEL